MSSRKQQVLISQIDRADISERRRNREVCRRRAYDEPEASTPCPSPLRAGLGWYACLAPRKPILRLGSSFRRFYSALNWRGQYFMYTAYPQGNCRGDRGDHHPLPVIFLNEALWIIGKN